MGLAFSTGAGGLYFLRSTWVAVLPFIFKQPYRIEAMRGDSRTRPRDRITLTQISIEIGREVRISSELRSSSADISRTRCVQLRQTMNHGSEGNYGWLRSSRSSTRAIPFHRRWLSQNPIHGN